MLSIPKTFRSFYCGQGKVLQSYRGYDLLLFKKNGKDRLMYLNFLSQMPKSWFHWTLDIDSLKAATLVDEISKNPIEEQEFLVSPMLLVTDGHYLAKISGFRADGLKMKAKEELAFENLPCTLIPLKVKGEITAISMLRDTIVIGTSTGALYFLLWEDDDHDLEVTAKPYHLGDSPITSIALREDDGGMGIIAQQSDGTLHVRSMRN